MATSEAITVNVDPSPAPSPVSAPGAVVISFEQVFFGTTTLAIALLVGTGKWLLDREVKRLASRFEDIYRRIGGQEQAIAADAQRLDDFKLEVNRTYVNREDYLRHQTLSEAKLDAVHRRLDQMFEVMTRGRSQP